MENELIDSDLDNTPKDVMIGIMRWWEKKRLLFNLIIIGIIVLTIVDVYSVSSINRLTSPTFFILSALYFLFLNICYCAGWGVQLLRYYYFNSLDDSKVLDIILFVIGTLFTAFVSYAGYYDFLRVFTFL